MNNQIRLVILGDQKVLRDAIAEYLAAENNISLIASFPTEWNFLEIVRQFDPSHILICIPKEMTDQFKVQMTKTAKRTNLQILALVDKQKPKDLAYLVLAGVNGFISLADWHNQLFRTIKGVTEKGFAIPFNMLKSVFDFLRNPMILDVSQNLTKKEIAVLHEVRRGLSYKELACHFNIGESTIRSHCKSIYRKLGVRGRIQAINTVFLNPGLQGVHLNISQ